MTRYERIKAMTIEEMAKKIIDKLITDDYCKGDCDGIDNIDNFDCPHEAACCVRWLMEEG